MRTRNCRPAKWAGAVVRDPPGTTCAARQPPGVDEIQICDGSNPCMVGGEIGLAIMLCPDCGEAYRFPGEEEQSGERGV